MNRFWATLCAALLLTGAFSSRVLVGDAHAGNTNLHSPSGVHQKAVTSNAKIEAYEREAIELMLAEANQVALELQLSESLPITKKALTSLFITPPQFAVEMEAVGTVGTSNYIYYMSRGNKFSSLDLINQETYCHKLINEYQWPITKIDTNYAYQVATQWLAAVSMDVAALNRDSKVCIRVSGPRGIGRRKNFTPIYSVFWPREKKGTGSLAGVRFFTPSKTLISLSVEDPKYILRKPLQITNLSALQTEPTSKIYRKGE
jgi:hypothetical protein